MATTMLDIKFTPKELHPLTPHMATPWFDIQLHQRNLILFSHMATTMLTVFYVF